MSLDYSERKTLTAERLQSDNVNYLRNSNGKIYVILEKFEDNVLLQATEDSEINPYVIASGVYPELNSWISGSYFTSRESAYKNFNERYNLLEISERIYNAKIGMVKQAKKVLLESETESSELIARRKMQEYLKGINSVLSESEFYQLIKELDKIGASPEMIKNVLSLSSDDKSKHFHYLNEKLFELQYGKVEK